MAVKTNKDLDRKTILRDTERLYRDPKSYKAYVSEMSNPTLSRKIKNGEIELTLKDLIDKGGEPLSE